MQTPNDSAQRCSTETDSPPREVEAVILYMWCVDHPKHTSKRGRARSPALEPFNLQLSGGEVVVTQSSGVDVPETTVTRWRYEQRCSRVLWIPAEPFHTIWGSERISRTITQQDKEPTPGRDAWALSADTRSSSLLDSYLFSFRYDDEDDEDVQKSLETRPLTLYHFVLCAHSAKISPKEPTKEYRNLNL